MTTYLNLEKRTGDDLKNFVCDELCNELTHNLKFQIGNLKQEITKRKYNDDYETNELYQLDKEYYKIYKCIRQVIMDNSVFVINQIKDHDIHKIEEELEN